MTLSSLLSFAEGQDYDVLLGCWIWRGRKDEHGYGLTTGAGGMHQRAHRAAYEMVHGPVPRELVMDHLCRVTSCINPEHLEPVTHAENIRRGLGARLTMEQAQEIRRLGAEGVNPSDIAPMFDTSRPIVCHILDGRIWRQGKKWEPAVYPERGCKHCGRNVFDFTKPKPGNRHKVYCSRSCRQRAYEKRAEARGVLRGQKPNRKAA